MSIVTFYVSGMIDGEAPKFITIQVKMCQSYVQEKVYENC